MNEPLAMRTVERMTSAQLRRYEELLDKYRIEKYGPIWLNRRDEQTYRAHYRLALELAEQERHDSRKSMLAFPIAVANDAAEDGEMLPRIMEILRADGVTDDDVTLECEYEIGPSPILGADGKPQMRVRIDVVGVWVR